MGKIAFKVVFDRKHKSDTKKNKGLVQVEAYLDRQRMYISTGVKVLKSQWDFNRKKVRNCLLQDEYNKLIGSVIKMCEQYRANCIDARISPSFSGLKNALQGNNRDDFFAFCEERINSRSIRESTKRQHRSAIQTLEEFGKIHYLSNITYENIAQYDEWLHRRYNIQSTIYSKHKVLRTYINEAITFGRLQNNPYSRFKVGHGKPSTGKFVRIEDIKKIKAAYVPKALDKVRDLILIQFYTGLAYSDIMNFSYRNIKDLNGSKVLIGNRNKTGIEYIVPLFKDVLQILSKYPNGLPKMSNAQYNLRIKKVFAVVGSECSKSVSSHWLRRGCGYWLLNNGVSMETVSRVLAHNSIKMTESVYAKLLPLSIINDVTRHVG